MFNLDTLSLKDTTSLHIKHPVTDELLYADEAKTKPVEIELYGTGSKQYRNALTAMQNRALKRGKKQATAEVMRDEGIELLVACSAKANNFAYNGKPLNDDSAFRALYGDASFSWLKEQVDAGLGDVSNFLQA
jgi:hypothetical protein